MGADRLHPAQTSQRTREGGVPAQGEVSKLCLEVNVDAAARDRLSAVLAATPISAVVLRPPSEAAAGRSSDIDASGGEARRGAGALDRLRSLVSIAQAAECAALVADDAALASAVGADGVHLTWSEEIEQRYAEARQVLGRTAIVGATARSRHQAMVLGEAGADYVGFERAVEAGSEATAFERCGGLIAWWADLIEVPCVALSVGGHEEARALACCGADFLSVTIDRSLTPAQAVERVRAVAGAADLAGRNVGSGGA